MENHYPPVPSVYPVILQRWHEISFFHWSCDPALIGLKLPEGLRLDTFDGKGWLSLTPFLLQGLRPPLAPRALGMNFPEMNLRTYVVGSRGPGIWFFSLDAARFVAVLGARATYGLPYFWSDMHIDIGAKDNFYFSNRAGSAKANIRIEKQERIADQSPLDIFLTARFHLYSSLRGHLITASVSHAPWELNRVRVTQLEETVREAMGVKFPSQDFIAHHSEGVDTKIGPPSSA
jgi:uncharacterized protein